jgi:hypothetical protein
LAALPPAPVPVLVRRKAAVNSYEMVPVS